MSTHDQILDAAENLFAEHGFRSTSLRQLTAAAEVNLAAVHYHFGSKDALITAVLARRLEPMNRERIERLERVRSEAAGRRVSLEEILECLIAPALGISRQPGGKAFLRLLGRLHTEPGDSPMQSLFFQQFAEVRDRFVGPLTESLPELPMPELFWRMHFVIGAMAHTMSCGAAIEYFSAGACRAGDIDQALTRLVEFAAAGLRAPVTVPQEGPS